MTGTSGVGPASGTWSDHPGTPESEWLTAVAAEHVPLLLPPGPGDHVLVLAAHPDDETLGAGGLVALAAARGARVEVVVATDGETSHPASPTHSREQLGALRRSEVREAVGRLAPSAAVTLLGLPDGGLDQHVRSLEDLLRERCTPTSLVVSTWRKDRHPDHEALARAVRSVLRSVPGARHWQYPVWAWHWAEPRSDDLPWALVQRLEIEASAIAAKDAAIAAYRSQHEQLSADPADGPVLDEAMLQHFRRPFEIFVVEPLHQAGAGAFFDSLYEQASDPWGLADRFYERRKRDLLLAALPRERFRRAFEPGCAIGLLTERLAERCDELVSFDVAELAVAATRERVRGRSNVQVERGSIPDAWPPGTFDLIVLSEVGYYCDDLAGLVRAVHGSLEPGGVVVGCHWRHPAADHPHPAEAVHAALDTTFPTIVRHVEDDFLLDVWSTDSRSVAVSTGIVGSVGATEKGR